jgi:hypothetical protein
MGGLPAWGLGKGVITRQSIETACYGMLYRMSDLD